MTLESQNTCLNGICDSVTVFVKASANGLDDQESVIQIEFDVINNDITIDPVQVTIDRVPISACHVHTDPHVVTYDGARYDLYTTGTFLLTKTLDSTHEVHVRTWQCGSHVSCVCGLVARENNDMVSVDMCDGEFGDTLPMLRVTNVAGDKIRTRIYEARGGKILMILFESGRSIHVFLEYWGLSVSLFTAAQDFGHTR